MKAVHFICGLPRSGSTLLCNLLNQNPDVYASSTSHVPHVLAAMTSVHTRSPEVKASTIREKEHSLHRLRSAMRGYVEGWYDADHGGHVVFDKSRLWNSHLPLLEWLYPQSKAVICVRDLRSIFASMERRHVETPMFDEAENIVQKSLYQRADGMFSPEGIIGSPLIGIEDAIRRDSPNKVFMIYETLAQNPQRTLTTLYDFLKLPAFEHDFEHVENVAEDIDALYHFKFPHEGSGKIEPSNESTIWERWVDPELSAKILNRYPLFYKTLYPKEWMNHENRLRPNAKTLG